MTSPSLATQAEAADALLKHLIEPRRSEYAAEETALLRQSDAHLIPFHDRSLAGYVWRGPAASHPSRILLVHGWESRATHWSAFIPALHAAGYEVCAFDAPAHGHSPGEQADVIRFGDAVVHAARHFGDIDAVLAHSLGSPAALYAFAQGLKVKASVHLSGPASLVRALQRGARYAGLSADAEARFRAAFEARIGHTADSMDLDRLRHGFRHPALLLHDPQDREVPFTESEALRQAWPDAVLEAVQGTGHRRILMEKSVIERSLAFLGDHL